MREAGDGSSPEIGRVLEGRYRLDAPIGEGGLGVVWRGFHLRLSKPVAIKLMLPEHLGRENLLARFEREAKSLAALSHPNIVDVIDFGVDQGAPFLVMELLEGRPLDRAIADGIAPERALAIGRDVLRALGHAHALGIVHRDLKPANVFLQRLSDGSEVVRVLDFGLAKFLDGEGREGEPQLTRAGTVLGTPAYMAPEQAMGGNADARADVYSFGILQFELITARRPFVGEGGELIRQHLLVALPSIESVRPDLEVSPELETVLQRATAKSPAARHASANELLQAFSSLPVPALRPRPGVAIPTTREDDPSDDATSAGGREPAAHAHAITGHEPTQVPSETQLARPSMGGAAEASAPTPHAVRDGGTAPMPVMPPISAAIVDTTPSPGPPSFATAARSAGGYGSSLAGVSASGGSSLAGVSASGDSFVAPRRHAGLALWLGLAAAVLVPSVVALGAALVWWNGATAVAPAPTPPVAPASVPASDPEPEAPEPWFAPDPDPWASDVPERLAPIHARLEQGRPLTRGDRTTIRRYVVQVRDDPRPWLLLAHGGFLEGARTDACDRYGRALEIDESLARGDRHILPDLARMAAHHVVADTAAALIRRHWGARALPELDAAIAATPERDEEGLARLHRLRDEIAISAAPGIAEPR